MNSLQSNTSKVELKTRAINFVMLAEAKNVFRLDTIPKTKAAMSMKYPYRMPNIEIMFTFLFLM